MRVRVGLPEDFEGTEREIIILSCVRVASPGVGRKKNKLMAKLMDFSALTNRIVATVTRAIDALYICGHLRTLVADETLRALIRDADKRRVIHTVSSYLHPSILDDSIRPFYNDLNAASL